jgi:hypothetical protein
MKQVNENTGSKLPKAIRETGTAHS